jgi:hypothetical protein
VQRIEARLHVAPRRALSSVAQRARHRSRQPDQVRLQHVVGRAILQRANRVFLAERPGNEQERSVRSQVARELQRRHAVEAVHREVRQDHFGIELEQRRAERLRRVDDAPVDPHARALELAHGQLGVGSNVLGEQNAHRDLLIALHRSGLPRSPPILGAGATILVLFPGASLRSPIARKASCRAPATARAPSQPRLFLFAFCSLGEVFFGFQVMRTNASCLSGNLDAAIRRRQGVAERRQLLKS